MDSKLQKSEAEWQAQLTPEQYQVLRRAGTERAFTGEYWNNHDAGQYRCAACGAELFSSEQKFDSGTGWPSFWAPMDDETVEIREDHTFGMHRTEVLCGKCESHLGHLFEDGPAPTHLRYCINSAALDFKPEQKAGEG